MAFAEARGSNWSLYFFTQFCRNNCLFRSIVGKSLEVLIFLNVWIWTDFSLHLRAKCLESTVRKSWACLPSWCEIIGCFRWCRDVRSLFASNVKRNEISQKKWKGSSIRTVILSTAMFTEKRVKSLPLRRKHYFTKLVSVSEVPELFSWIPRL